MLRAIGRSGVGFMLIMVGVAGANARADDTAAISAYLEQGDAPLREKILAAPKNDSLRAQLGIVQFLRAWENLGAGLYKYGLRTERSFVRPAPAIRDLLPQNPNPEKIGYAEFRGLLEKFVRDLETSEATLAGVTDPQVKLTLDVTQVKIDPFGQQRRIPFAMLAGVAGERTEPLVIAFDRGDMHWLRGYTHFLMAWGEVLLAHDLKEIFERTAHRLFERVDSPHAFLQEERRAWDERNWWDVAFFQDAIAFIHLWRFPIKEPAGMQRALAHFEAMSAQSREMWKHFQAETDDDREWIPNPKQKGVLGITVSEAMVTEWLATLDEIDLVLKGERLIPFWRGNQADRGVNLRRVFTEPRDLDVLLWIQGTAATPFLEKGPLTSFARPDRWLRMQESFGGPGGLFRTAVWFN